MIYYILLFLLLYLLSGIYVFKRSHYFTKGKIIKKTIVIFNVIIVIFIVGAVFFLGKPHSSPWHFRLYFHLNFLFFLSFIFNLFLFIFYLLTDITIKLFIHKNGKRIAKLRQIFGKIALSAVIFIYVFLFHGYFFGITNFKIKTYELVFKNLPEAFNGIKILHFSDTHFGSFLKEKNAIKGLEMIKSQEADLVLFTGDLVNISATEIFPYIVHFSEIEAKYGKFAVLGNHDLSDYRKLDIPRDSLNVNTNKIVEILNITGFTVLRDTAVNINEGSDKIQVAGIDNIGKPPFRAIGNYGRLFKNIDKNEDIFTILLCHAPSFWSDIVIKEKRNISLTLSGHTHGMQFGIRTKHFNWIPFKYKHKELLGLYSHNEQILHINPGFGFIGLPFRVGIYPEITVIILRNN